MQNVTANKIGHLSNTIERLDSIQYTKLMNCNSDGIHVLFLHSGILQEFDYLCDTVIPLINEENKSKIAKRIMCIISTSFQVIQDKSKSLIEKNPCYDVIIIEVSKQCSAS